MLDLTSAQNQNDKADAGNGQVAIAKNQQANKKLHKTSCKVLAGDLQKKDLDLRSQHAHREVRT